jgi:hypothetical protein
MGNFFQAAPSSRRGMCRCRALLCMPRETEMGTRAQAPGGGEPTWGVGWCVITVLRRATRGREEKSDEMKQSEMKQRSPFHLKAKGIAQALNELSHPGQVIRKSQVGGSSPLAGSTLFAGLLPAPRTSSAVVPLVVPASTIISNQYTPSVLYSSCSA